MLEARSDSQTLLPSIAFGVKTPRLVAKLPGTRGELWSAQVKAVRGGVFCNVFEDILFVEANETAYLFGIEEGDGRPKGLRADLANKQQAFISFLRDQTQLDLDGLGLLAHVFTDQAYSSEALVTAAYVVARDEPMNIGIGYWSEAGTYARIAIPKSDEFFEMARMTLPFDELG